MVEKNIPFRSLYKQFTAWVRGRPFWFALAQTLLQAVLACRKGVWLLRRPGLIRKYLRGHPIKKLQLGTYNNALDGWLNSDVYLQSSQCVFLDAARPFPFADHTFDYIFSEHMIEHISYDEGLGMLHECLRVLRPGGKIRIATPNLDSFVSLFSAEKNDLQKRYMQWYTKRYLPTRHEIRQSFIINRCFYGWNHKFVYDFTTLRDSFEQAGFIDIRLCLTCESEDEHFQEIDTHGAVVGNEEFNRFETLVLEGQRPQS